MYIPDIERRLFFVLEKGRADDGVVRFEEVGFLKKAMGGEVGSVVQVTSLCDRDVLVQAFARWDHLANRYRRVPCLSD